MMTVNSLFHIVPTLETLNYRERLDRFIIDTQNLPEWVIFAVVNGSFYYEINELKGIAAYGDIVVCPPNTNFRRAVVSSPITFFAIRIVWRSISGVPLEPSELTAVPVGRINIQTTERLMDNYRRLAAHDMLYTPIDLIKGNHVIHDIWLLYCDERNEQTKAENRLLLNEKDDVIEKARSLLRQHALEALKLKEIAATLGVSAAQLTKWFKAVYDVTPIQYVTMIRLKRAQKLLLETNMTLEQISECCGYQSGYYLNRIFKKHFKITPSRFRKSQRI